MCSVSNVWPGNRERGLGGGLVGQVWTQLQTNRASCASPDGYRESNKPVRVCPLFIQFGQWPSSGHWHDGTLGIRIGEYVCGVRSPKHQTNILRAWIYMLHPTRCVLNMSKHYFAKTYALCLNAMLFEYLSIGSMKFIFIIIPTEMYIHIYCIV